MAANLPIKQLNRNVADTEYLSWLTQLATAGQDIDIVEVFVFLTLCICPGSLNLQQDKTSISGSIVRILGTSSVVAQNHIGVCIGWMFSVLCANTGNSMCHCVLCSCGVCPQIWESWIWFGFTRHC